MTFSVNIIADSISPVGKRLTTITATYPRFIHAEVMTHRDRARNAASSRAIPWPKMQEAITHNPVVPIEFGTEKKGMQTGGALTGDAAQRAWVAWIKARDAAMHYAQELHDLGVHKSLVNRLIEPFAWITVVMTATEWNNFFRLRCHPDAEVHFQKIACMIRDALAASTPKQAWLHLPFIQEDEITSQNVQDLSRLAKISTARCARVSYLTHDGKRDQEADLALFARLCEGSGFGHWSPHEHVATASMDPCERSGPFVGWLQYRKSFENENMAG